MHPIFPLTASCFPQEKPVGLSPNDLPIVELGKNVNEIAFTRIVLERDLQLSETRYSPLGVSLGRFNIGSKSSEQKTEQENPSWLAIYGYVCKSNCFDLFDPRIMSQALNT